MNKARVVYMLFLFLSARRSGAVTNGAAAAVFPSSGGTGHTAIPRKEVASPEHRVTQSQSASSILSLPMDALGMNSLRGKSLLEL